MKSDSQCDVFVSDNQADKPQVKWLAERLRAADHVRGRPPNHFGLAGMMPRRVAGEPDAARPRAPT